MTHRERNIDGTVVPSASTTTVTRCGDPHCQHAHLIGRDEEGKPLCEIVVDLNIVRKAFAIIEGTS